MSRHRRNRLIITFDHQQVKTRLIDLDSRWVAAGLITSCRLFVRVAWIKFPVRNLIFLSLFPNLELISTEGTWQFSICFLKWIATKVIHFRRLIMAPPEVNLEEISTKMPPCKHENFEHFWVLFFKEGVAGILSP